MLAIGSGGEMRVFFLDIDGVLNDHSRHLNGYSPIQTKCVVELNKILLSDTTAMIVLSSAWRYVFNEQKVIETLLACHGVHCVGRIHGCTRKDEEFMDREMPDYSDIETWSAEGLRWRVGQIMRYVEEHGIEHFVVIDDLDLDVPNLVKTDPKVGLTHDDAMAVILKLRENQP